MPELPEVQTTVDGLHSKVLNRTFVDVWSDWEKIVKKPTGFKEFKRLLKGKKILRVWRRAKNVILELSQGYSLLIHMKMTGHLLVGKKHGKFLHIIFYLNDGQIIALSDMRKFAKIQLQKTSELMESQEMKSLGPEPLEKNFTLEKFVVLFAKKRGRVKQVIMDQSVIAGIGNIYASEALWVAKIHPEKQVGKLSHAELQALYTAIKKVLVLGVKFGGDSFSDYRNVDGEMGKFEGKKNAYQREGEPCYRCASPIIRSMIGGRSAFFCPQCQKL